jgi:uracil phosphoribosyltransferase
MLHNLSENNSLLHQYLLEIRSTAVQKDRMRFRRNLERIGEIMAYEISKTLAYKKELVQTPLAETDIQVVAEQPVLAIILRAALPMYQGLLNYFDKADNAFISAYRKHKANGDFEIELEYTACPSLEGRTLIMCDPMLATGSSMVVTIQKLAKMGTPKQIHLAAAIASQPGIEYVQKHLPHVTIWTAWRCW